MTPPAAAAVDRRRPKLALDASDIRGSGAPGELTAARAGVGGPERKEPKAKRRGARPGPRGRSGQDRRPAEGEAKAAAPARPAAARWPGTVPQAGRSSTGSPSAGSSSLRLANVAPSGSDDTRSRSR